MLYEAVFVGICLSVAYCLNNMIRNKKHIPDKTVLILTYRCNIILGHNRLDVWDFICGDVSNDDPLESIYGTAIEHLGGDIFSPDWKERIYSTTFVHPITGVSTIYYHLELIVFEYERLIILSNKLQSWIPGKLRNFSEINGCYRLVDKTFDVIGMFPIGDFSLVLDVFHKYGQPNIHCINTAHQFSMINILEGRDIVTGYEVSGRINPYQLFMPLNFNLDMHGILSITDKV